MNFLEMRANPKTLSVLSDSLLALSKVAIHKDSNLDSEVKETFERATRQSIAFNPWFTEASISQAFESLAYMLQPDSLEKWLAQYDFENVETGKTIGLVLAGNLPMVGFHDVFCTLVAGHKPVVKVSSQDKILLPTLFEYFDKLIPEFDFSVTWTEDRLPKVDAVIATGSNNTSRYFEYYFRDIPHIIRKNRSSVAILTGDESQEELTELGHDIFGYFGMGCRSISKMYVPEDFELDRFFKAIYTFNTVINHNKYGNNFDYYRALWLMNQEEILENGFLIVRPSEAIASPTATLFYERYQDVNEVYKTLASKEDEVQCIVSKNDIPFGNSQKPELWDYADGVDTMEFLMNV